MKRTTSRAREFVPCWSAHHGPARTRAKSQTPGRLKHIEEFPDGVLTLALIRRSDGRAGTRLEMVFQQQRIDLLQRTLDGHGLFDDIDAVGPILDHPGHAPHVSLDAAQADGGLGPNVRGAMLEVDLGHRHTAPPPTLPPPLWGGVRPIIASPRGFRIAILPGDASYRETPITCTSRAATVPSPLACPTITTRSLACSAAQDARKPWNRVVALMMMMMRVSPVSRTTIRFGPRATTTPRQLMSLPSTVIRPTGAASRSLACAGSTRQAAVTSTIGIATRCVRTGVTSTVDTHPGGRGFRRGTEKRQRLPPSDPRISRPDAAADSRP